MSSGSVHVHVPLTVWVSGSASGMIVLMTTAALHLSVIIQPVQCQWSNGHIDTSQAICDSPLLRYQPHPCMQLVKIRSHTMAVVYSSDEVSAMSP